MDFTVAMVINTILIPFKLALSKSCIITASTHLKLFGNYDKTEYCCCVRNYFIALNYTAIFLKICPNC